MDASLEYGLVDADVVAHFDAASVVPGNYKVLSDLPNQPAIKSNPELVKMARQLINEVEGPRAFAKSMVGFDPVTDLSDLTAFATIVPHSPPTFVVVAHGKFDATMLDKIAKLTGKQVAKVGAASVLELGDGNAVAITKSGALLTGAAALVKERVAATWKAPSHAPGTSLGQAADMLAGHPVFGVSMTMSQTLRSEVLRMHPDQNFLTDLAKRGKGTSFAIYRDGIGWTWSDTTAAGLDQMATLSDGLVDLLRSAQIAPRGFAKIALAALDSYKGVNPQIDALIAHKADLNKIVASYIGDGQFKSKIDKDPKALRVAVRLTGKSLSEVIPVGVVIPMMAFGFMVERTVATQPAAIAAPARPAPTKPVLPSGKR
ncbi:MAG: hypothetical protein ABI591_15415 [Kofleriaceae bacterium]